MSKKIKRIELRISEADQKILLKLQHQTNENTASKAITTAMRSYDTHLNRIARLENELKELRGFLYDVKRAFRDRQAAHSRLAELMEDRKNG